VEISYLPLFFCSKRSLPINLSLIERICGISHTSRSPYTITLQQVHTIEIKLSRFWILIIEEKYLIILKPKHLLLASGPGCGSLSVTPLLLTRPLPDSVYPVRRFPSHVDACVVGESAGSGCGGFSDFSNRYALIDY